MQTGKSTNTMHSTPQRNIAGLSMMGIATLLAVTSVIVVITLSSLRGMAITENESHAQSLLSAIAGSLNSQVFAAPPSSLEEVTQSDSSLESNLTDGEFLSKDGCLFVRHGYLFEWREENAGGSILLVAWPFDLGQTGRKAFALTREGKLVTHPNQALGWSGLDRRPSKIWPGL
jgi:hypothetical protein